MPRKIRRDKGQHLQRLNRTDMAKIRKLLRDHLGEYSEEDFETFLGHYQERDQIKIRRIEAELRG